MKYKLITWTIVLLLLSSVYAIDIGLDEQRGVRFGHSDIDPILWSDIIGSKYIIDDNGILDIDESQLNLTGSSVNTSNLWDDLDTPADINAGDITDDGTYILTSNEGNLNVNYSENATSCYNWAGLNVPNASWYSSDTNESPSVEQIEGNIGANQTAWESDINTQIGNCTGNGCNPINLNVTDYTILENHTDITGELNIIHTSTHNDDHAVEIFTDADGFGDVSGLELFFDTGIIETGEDEEVLLIVIDDFSSTGGSVAGVEVITTEGGAEVHGLTVGATVHPILQESGTFTNMDSVDNNGRNDLTNFTSTLTDSQIFVNDNDNITIGNAEHFEEIEIILDTESSKTIAPVFEFSTGAGTWQVFSPVDATDGFTHNGAILWELDDVTGWTLVGGEYLIKITRTRNNINTPPIEDFVQVADITEYEWDKDGNISINSLQVGDDVNISDDLKVGGIATFFSELILGDGDLTTAGSIMFNRSNNKLIIGVGGGFLQLNLGAWKTYTPTWTGIGANAPTLDYARYTQIGKLVTCRIGITMVAGSVVNGAVIGTLPVTAHASQASATNGVGSVMMLDAGVAIFHGALRIPSTTTVEVLRHYDLAVSHQGQITVLDATHPMSWAIGDKIEMIFTYEAS